MLIFSSGVKYVGECFIHRKSLNGLQAVIEGISVSTVSIDSY